MQECIEIFSAIIKVNGSFGLKVHFPRETDI